MEVRRIKDNELNKLLDLHKYLNPEDIKATEDDLFKTWELIKNNKDKFAYFVIEHNNILISSCNISIIPNLTRGSRPFGVIENVITHPDYRKMGLGKKIIDAAVDFAKINNCYKVMLLSNVKRKEAHLFYKKLGFDENEKKGFTLSL